MTTTASVPRPTQEPVRYGRFVLVDRLGAGGMAEVFRALVLGPEQFQSAVVVQRILPRLCANPAFIKMFIDEARLCGRLSHPNVIRVHDFGKQEGQYFIAMEYVQGRNLTPIIRRLIERNEAMAPTIAAEIARQACRGLHYAHSLVAPDGQPLNIVHRDISPGNVMVAHSGVVKVLDFGVARVENRFRQALTDPGQVKGKAAYLAPEQLAPGPLDHRADVFSVGILLHEMLAGRRLFRGETSLDSMKLVKTLPIPPPSVSNAAVSPALDAITLRALARDPAQRYQSAGEMADALEAFLLESRFSSQELPAFMRRLFGEEYQQDEIDLSRADLQLLLQESVSQRLEVPVTSVTGAGLPESAPGVGPPASSLVAAWPEIDPEGSLERLTGGRPQLVKWGAAGAAIVVALIVVLGIRHAGGARQGAQAAVAPTPVETAKSVSPSATSPPAEAPAAAMVRIAITSEPAGAAVFHPGAAAPTGLTPLVVTAARGTQPLAFRISKPGYVEGALSVVPDVDKPALVTLARSPAAPAPAPPPRRQQRVRNAIPMDPFSR